MGYIIGVLTFVLVLVCVALILLVLVQLPKKEAGAGLAFGGAASDALFGAGSGNMLTKITKWAAILFFLLAIGVGLMQSKIGKRTVSDFQKELEQQASQPAAATLPPATKPATAVVPAATNLLTTPAAAATNR